MKASIVVLTYNNLDYTRQCLDSIYAKTDEPDFEVILVDNASQDGTPDYLRGFAETHSDVQLILNPSNEGFSRGNNQGAAIAAGKYLVFLNNDVVVTKGWLPGLISHLKDPTVGMVGPVTNSSGNESRIAVNYQNLGEMDQFSQNYTEQHRGEAFEIEMLPFYCVAMRREVFEEVGPLDERFEVGMFEDDDYAVRLKKKDYKTLCAEDVFIHHWGSASFEKLAFSTYWQLFRENLSKFEQKWGIEWRPHTQRAEFLPAQLRTSIDAMVWITQVVAERDQTIGELQGQITERNQTITSLQDRLADDHKAITSLQDRLAENEQSITDLQARLADREQLITNVQNQLANRDHLVAELQTQLSGRDQMIANLQSQAADTQRSINWLSIELNNIYQSNGWAFLQALLRIRRGIIPEGSRREMVFRRYIQGIRPSHWKHIKRQKTESHQASPVSRPGETALLAKPGNLVQGANQPVSTLQPSVASFQIPQRDSAKSTNQSTYPFVSVIIPVYNHADMLEAAARSVLNSSYTNFELIILDDGSTDDIEHVLNRLTHNPRVRVYRQPNQKLPRALTHAHRFAQGEFITWISSDNMIASQALDVMVKALLDHPEVVMVYADPAGIDDQGNPLLDESYRPQNVDPLRRDVIRLYKDARSLGYETDNFINACFLYRRQAAQVLEGHYADDLRGLEDYDFWLRMQKAGPFLHVENQEPLYYYRVHTRTMSHELLSTERDPHLLRGQRLIEFEAQRRNYAEQRWTLSFDPAIHAEERDYLSGAADQLPVDIVPWEKRSSNLPSQGIPKHLRFIAGKKDLNQDDPIYVKVFPGEWELIWHSPWSGESRGLRHWNGISINPLALKARSYRKNIWEFAQAGQRPIIGCHLRLSEYSIDIDAARRIIASNPWAFFVFLDEPGYEDAGRGESLVQGLENARYLGARPLWEPYLTYACFDIIWLPPIASPTTVNGHANDQQAYKILSALAYATARPLIFPDNLSPEAYPYQYFYQVRIEEMDFIQDLLSVKLDTAVLDRYLEAWTPAERLRQLLKYADAITQESSFARPDFGIATGAITLPTRWTPTLTQTSDTIRCALVVNSLDRGGLEEIVATLALGLLDYQVEPCVLCINEEGLVAERLKSRGIRVFIAEGKAEKIWGFFEREHPQVINTHFGDIQLLEIADKFNIPIIETIHNTYAWFNRAGWQLEKQRSLYFTYAIAVSQFVKQYYARWNTAFNSDRIGVIPNGINTQNIIIADQNQARAELQIPQETFLFLNLASYDGRKNQLGLLTAFDQVGRKYPQAQLWCAGNVADPRYFEFISQYHEKLQSKSQIQLHRYRHDTGKLLSAANVFVLDSFFEGWSLAASEAIVAGLPLIHSECGSAYELVGRSGERGIIVPNAGGNPITLDWNTISNTIYKSQQLNTAALTEAMSTMIEEGERWSSERNNIHEYGLTALAADQMVKSYYETIQSILGELITHRINDGTRIRRSAKYAQWLNAQDQEFKFWQQVGTIGYAGATPEGFLSEIQHNLMLNVIEYLEKPVTYWENKIIVEFGPGPAGIVEYIKGQRKIAVEPLIEKYRTVYPHLSNSDVEYLPCAAEDAWKIPDQVADLAICFNVLDHTIDPDLVISQLSRVCKPGAELLFQLNVYLSDEELSQKSGLHAELHPHSFFPKTITGLLEKHGFEVWKQFCEEDRNATGEHYFLCACRKKV